MKKNILIVDDDSSLLDSLRRKLDKCCDEFNLYFCSDSLKVDDLLNTYKIDLLVTDMLMPDKDGVEIISEIKHSGSNLKIIAMSGGGSIDSEIYLEYAREFGAVYSIAKPFCAEDLLALIQKAFLCD